MPLRREFPSSRAPFLTMLVVLFACLPLCRSCLVVITPPIFSDDESPYDVMGSFLILCMYDDSPWSIPSRIHLALVVVGSCNELAGVSPLLLDLLLRGQFFIFFIFFYIFVVARLVSVDFLFRHCRWVQVSIVRDTQFGLWNFAFRHLIFVLNVACSPSTVFLSSPIPPFEWKDAGVAASIKVVLGMSFSSMDSECSGTPLMRHGPSAVGINFIYIAVWVFFDLLVWKQLIQQHTTSWFRGHHSQWVQVVHILVLTARYGLTTKSKSFVWIPVFWVCLYPDCNCIAFVRRSFECERCILWVQILVKGGYAERFVICFVICFRISSKKLQSEFQIIFLQPNILTVPNQMRKHTRDWMKLGVTLLCQQCNEYIPDILVLVHVMQ